jgi:hypothetical protein
MEVLLGRNILRNAIKGMLASLCEKAKFFEVKKNGRGAANAN